MIELAEAERITQTLDLRTVLPAQAAVAFVFGTRLPEPALLAADLYKRGAACHIALTGGENRLTGVNEARAHLEIVLNAGVPRSKITIEDRSTNTLENVRFTLPLLEKLAAAGRLDRVIAVTKWYHSRRAVMTLKRHFPPGTRFWVASYEPSQTPRAGWWNDPAGSRPVLKEWEAIPRYQGLGHLAKIQFDGEAFI